MEKEGFAEHVIGIEKMDDNFYEREGLKYDRITRILDFFKPPELIDWYLRVGKKEAKRISTTALKIGTNVDEVIKARITGNKVPKIVSPEAINCLNAFDEWERNYSLKVSPSNTVFDDGLMMAGTPDLDDGNTVFDIKCSSEIRPAYWLQTEFYGRCLGVTHKAIIRLDKNLALYEYKKMPLCDEHWEACLGAIKLYRFYKKSV